MHSTYVLGQFHVYTIFLSPVRSQWQATLYPLLLTALLYLGPLVMAALESLSDYASYETEPTAEFRRCSFSNLVGNLSSLTSDIYAWRNFVVVISPAPHFTSPVTYDVHSTFWQRVSFHLIIAVQIFLVVALLLCYKLVL